MKIKTIISLVALCSCASITQANPLTSETAQSSIKVIKKVDDFAHFSFPIKSQAQLTPAHQSVAISSDEYWIQVTGEQLNKGVALHSTQANTLIRVTQGQSGKHAQRAPELDTSLLQLTSSETSKSSVIEQLVSANQLAETGVFDKTVGIKTASPQAVGKLLLKTSQNLNADDTYMISVKEKGSAYRLNFNLDAQSYAKNQPMNASATLANGNKAISPKDLIATLIAPDGKQTPVDFTINEKGKIALALSHPEKTIAPRHGLYEIMLKVSGEENGLKVQRNAKLALALTQPTAQLNGTILDSQAVEAKVAVKVDKESRFEVRGILFATNNSGQLIPVMETHAAQTLKVGENQLPMPFDAKILQQAQVTAPYELRNIRLFDQQQLGLIDNQH